MLLRSSGEQFQRLFNELMSRSHSGFVPVQPWGNLGDRGNDGYIATELRFFQLHAPSGASPNAKVSSEKAVKDFSKLLAAYNDLKNYHFVLNDRFQGIPAPVAEAHHSISQSNGQLKECFPIGCHALRSRFEGLNEAKQVLIVGDLPSKIPHDLDLTVLGSLLRDLADTDDDVALGRIDLPAEFDIKADFNNFSDELKTQLRHYARRSHVVDKMLTSRDPSWVQAISEEVASRYQSLSEEDNSDVRLLKLAELLVPEVAKSHPHTLKAYRESAYLVIAKYFEACDVFENPNSVNTTKAHKL
jgi:hypothetical protein